MEFGLKYFLIITFTLCAKSCSPKNNIETSTQKRDNIFSVSSNKANGFTIFCARDFTIANVQTEVKWKENYITNASFQKAVNQDFICERLRKIENNQMTCAMEIESTPEEDYIESQIIYKSTESLLSDIKAEKICEGAAKESSSNTENSSTEKVLENKIPANTSAGKKPPEVKYEKPVVVSKTEMKEKITQNVMPVLFNLKASHVSNTWFKKSTLQASDPANAGKKKCEINTGTIIPVAMAPSIQPDKKHFLLRMTQIPQNCEFVLGFVFGPHFSGWPESIQKQMQP
jgi:hypothetical protein